MKIRQGFVSNSSSSSFIVAFPHKPSDVNELQKMLFGDESEYPNPYDWEGMMKSWPASTVSKTVWDDLRDSEPVSKSEITEDIINGYIQGEDDIPYPHYTDDMEERTRLWKEYDRKRKELAEKVVTKFLNKVPKDSELFEFHYADDDNYGAALEHGTLFDKLPHLKVSHH